MYTSHSWLFSGYTRFASLLVSGAKWAVSCLSLLWLGLIISRYFPGAKTIVLRDYSFCKRSFLSRSLVIIGRSMVVLLQRACLRAGASGIRRVVSFGSQKLPEVLQRTLDKDDRSNIWVTSPVCMASFTKRNIAVSIWCFIPIPGSLGDDPAHQSLPQFSYCSIRSCRRCFADVPHQLSSGDSAFVPLLSFRKPTPLDGWGVFKRAFDLVVGLSLLIVLSPLLFFCCLAQIVLVNGFPIFCQPSCRSA